MSIHEQARAEAEKRHVPYRSVVTGENRWPRSYEAFIDGYLAGHEAATKREQHRQDCIDAMDEAATRTRVVTVDQLTDALYEATQDPNDIDVPDVAKRLHALLYEPEEDR